MLRVRRRSTSPRKAADWENAYYLSSQPVDARTPEQWLQTVRDHWAGVEIRNHWRKDAILFEDKTRSRNPNLVGCLMLLRNLVLHFYSEHQNLYGPLPAFVETLAARPSLAWALIRGVS